MKDYVSFISMDYIRYSIVSDKCYKLNATGQRWIYVDKSNTHPSFTARKRNSNELNSLRKLQVYNSLKKLWLNKTNMLNDILINFCSIQLADNFNLIVGFKWFFLAFFGDLEKPKSPNLVSMQFHNCQHFSAHSNFEGVIEIRWVGIP